MHTQVRRIANRAPCVRCPQKGVATWCFPWKTTPSFVDEAPVRRDCTCWGSQRRRILEAQPAQARSCGSPSSPTSLHPVHRGSTGHRDIRRPPQQLVSIPYTERRSAHRSVRRHPRQQLEVSLSPHRRKAAHQGGHLGHLSSEPGAKSHSSVYRQRGRYRIAITAC